MNKTYQAPVLEDLGAVPSLTAALGNSARADFSEFSQIQSGTGSFDVCDSDFTNSPQNSFCEAD